MRNKDRMKVAAIVAIVIVINVVLWKCSTPTKWEITHWIFG